MKTSFVIPAEYNLLSDKLMHPNVFIIRAIRFGIVGFTSNLVIYILYLGLTGLWGGAVFCDIVPLCSRSPSKFSLTKYWKWVFRQVRVDACRMFYYGVAFRIGGTRLLAARKIANDSFQ